MNRVDVCFRDELEELKRVITRENVDDVILFDNTALSLCCVAHKHLDCVKWLVEEMNAGIGISLIRSAQGIGSFPCLQYLLTRDNVNIHATDSSGATALTATTSPRVVWLLLQHGAGIDLVQLNRAFALAINDLISVSRSAPGRVVALLMYGANIDAAAANNPRAQFAVRAHHALKEAHRSAANAAGALLWSMTRRGAPRDMARWCVRNYVMADWVQYCQDEEVMKYVPQ